MKIATAVNDKALSTCHELCYAFCMGMTPLGSFVITSQINEANRDHGMV